MRHWLGVTAQSLVEGKSWQVIDKTQKSARRLKKKKNKAAHMNRDGRCQSLVTELLALLGESRESLLCSSIQ